MKPLVGTVMILLMIVSVIDAHFNHMDKAIYSILLAISLILLVKEG